MENDAQRHLNSLGDDELTRLILTLARYAVNKSGRYRWRSGNRIDLPSGETIDSVVSLAIELVLDGTRTWNRETDPDFADFLMDVLDSRLYHLATGLDNTVNRRAAIETDLADLQPVAVTHPTKHRREQAADWLSRKPGTPEQELLEKEVAREQKAVVEKFEASIEGDDELVKIFAAIRAGQDTDKQIAEFTGIAVEKVRNAKKRMARRVGALREEFSEN